MNKEFFIDLISSYGFKEMELPEDMRGLFKYYELRFEESEPRPDLTFYWYEDGTFSLYKNEGFAVVKLCDDKMNLYNLKLAIEKNIPRKVLKEINS